MRGKASGPRSFSRWRSSAEAHPFVIEHPSGHERPGDLALARGAEQQPDGGHRSVRVDPYRDRVDVQDRHALAGGVQLLGASHWLSDCGVVCVMRSF